MSKFLSICSNFHPMTGGTFTTVQSFRRILHAPVVSFYDRSLSYNDDGTSILPINCWSSLIGRVYGWAPSAALAEAEQQIVGSEVVCAHVLFRYAAQWAAAACQRQRRRFWFVAHGTLDPYVFSYRALRKHVFMHSIGKKVLSTAERVIFSSGAELKKAAKWLPDLSRAVTLYWPVDMVAPYEPEHVRPKVYKNLDVAEGKRLLVWVGRLHPMKQPLLAAQAIARAAPANVELIMVGPDEVLRREQCEAYCKKHGIQGVRWVGPVFGQEKDELFRAAHGFISTSIRENFGYTTADALRYGKPLILTPGNDLASDIAVADCGWLPSSSALEVVADAIGSFSRTSTKQLCEMGERGRAWAADNLNAEIFSEQVHKLL